MTIKYIVINATALKLGGASTILRQFLDEIPDDDFKYIVFADRSFPELKRSNLSMVFTDVTTFRKRFLWDLYGVKNWLIKHKITPAATLSLQNTNFRINATCPNFIYYHQPVPLYPYKWSFFKSQERSLWFYRNIYPYFVRAFINSNTEIFVQLDCIKESFIKAYQFEDSKVHVVFPRIEYPVVQYQDCVKIDHDKINLFYPAVNYAYKNHSILFESLRRIDNMLLKKVVVYFSIDSHPDYSSDTLKNVEFNFLGKIPFSSVVWMYSKMDALVFPSYIETFGLPLIEAASFGKPILVADLPYAHEVLEGYEGATYLKPADVSSWADNLLNMINHGFRYFQPFEKKTENSWDHLFSVIKKSVSE